VDERWEIGGRVSDESVIRRPLVEADFRRMRLPVRYRDATFPIISEGEHKRIVEDYLVKMEKFLGVGWGLLIYGPPSTGKTSIASVILQEAVRRGHTGLFVKFEEYLGARKLGFDDTTTYEVRAKSVQLLVLDEAAFKSLTPSDRRALDDLIRHRIDERLATIITTNDNAESATMVCGPEFMELVKGSFYPVVVAGRNYRDEEQQQIVQEFTRNDEHPAQ
jgi:DNA replication protein DnaC